MTAVVVATTVALALFAARRLVLLVAALLPARHPRDLAREALPLVTIVVPARNEAAVADCLLEALGALDYPVDRLSFVLVCDGCADGTADLFRRWAGERDSARLVELERRTGKAGALNAGLAVTTGEVVIVLDADLRPRPDLVRRLVTAFSEPAVGAAAAFVAPANVDASLASRYAALNALVHQLVTSAGKDRLRLDPPTLGASAYRRSALADVGGFCATALGEDVEMTHALTRAGWTTRFVPTAVAEHDVVSNLRSYWAQHVRWTRATLEARNRRRHRGRVSLARRVESALATIGDGDRLVVVAALALAVTGSLAVWVPAAYVLLRVVEIGTVLARTRVARRLPGFALAAAALFPVDVAASVAAVVLVATRRRGRWSSARPVYAARRPT